MELTRYLSPRKVQGLDIPKCFLMATFSFNNKWGQADWCLFLPNSSIHQQQLHVGMPASINEIYVIYIKYM